MSFKTKSLLMFIVFLTVGQCFGFGEKPLQQLFENADFEKGDLTNWRASGDAFKYQPTLGDNGSGQYVIGQFDGKNFGQDEGIERQRLIAGGSYYGTQTFSLAGQNKEQRRIQMAWMVAFESFANMQFSQQLSLPSELKLKTFPEGVKITRIAVKEVYDLRGEKLLTKNDFTLKPGDNPLKYINGDLLNIVMEFEPVEKGRKGSFYLDLRGGSTRFEFYGEHDNLIQVTRDYCFDKPLERESFFEIKGVEPFEQAGTYKIEMFLDRTSLDVYIDDGRYSAPLSIWPTPNDFSAEMKVTSGSVKFKSLEIWRMNSAWKRLSD